MLCLYSIDQHGFFLQVELDGTEIGLAGSALEDGGGSRKQRAEQLRLSVDKFAYVLFAGVKFEFTHWRTKAAAGSNGWYTSDGSEGSTAGMTTLPIVPAPPMRSDCTHPTLTPDHIADASQSSRKENALILCSSENLSTDI